MEITDVTVGKKIVGQATTAIWSPFFKKNVALGMVRKGYWDFGQTVELDLPDGSCQIGEVSKLPFSL